MMNMKTMMVCGMMMLPSLTWAQNCCQNKKDKQEVPCCQGTNQKACCEMNNAVIQTIMSRQSIRKYLDKQVEHEKLALIAKCGVHAPNALNKQPWAVRVVESQDFINGTTAIFKKEKAEQVKRDPNFKNMYRNTHHLIVVATPKGEGQVDAGLLGENMMLAAKSLGLGTCCLGSAASFLNNSEACKPYLAKLNLPQGYEICYVLAVGYPDETPAMKTRDESKIEFVK